MNQKRANTIEMFQRVQGEITWDHYVRLRHFAKRSKTKIHEIVGTAIVEYLDRADGRMK